MAQNRDMQRAGQCSSLDWWPDSDFDLEPQVACGVRESVTQRKFTGRIGTREIGKYAEDQAATQDDLLSVENEQRKLRQLVKQTRGHARTVAAGQRDQQCAVDSHRRSGSTAPAGRVAGSASSGTLYATIAASRTA